MPTRHLAIVLSIALAACLDATRPPLDAPSFAERQDDIICTPMCGGDDSYENTLTWSWSYSSNLFPDLRPPFSSSCADVGTGAIQQWDCVVTFVAPSNPCGWTAVECLQHRGGMPSCSWSNPNNCP